MKNIIKLLSLVFILSLTTVACNDNKACKEDCKKECCEKKEKEACEPGCEKECCKVEVDEATPAAADSTTEVVGDEQAHMCTEECQSDPHSCPNHSHDDH
ncbi:MAG: hypothetical protein QNL19_04230 [Bacteroidota bacterium]|jgi:hypothetical protein|tara:strand:+ start:117 stop:416 length:300 start_codon:yes stop_codon:yes gene_type:complete